MVKAFFLYKENRPTRMDDDRQTALDGWMDGWVDGWIATKYDGSDTVINM
jgi:hypothetical protein